VKLFLGDAREVEQGLLLIPRRLGVTAKASTLFDPVYRVVAENVSLLPIARS